MNNKIEITKVLKNSDEYTEEELKSGKLYQVGLEYNGKIYYFSKPVTARQFLLFINENNK